MEGGAWIRTQSLREARSQRCTGSARIAGARARAAAPPEAGLRGPETAPPPRRAATPPSRSFPRGSRFHSLQIRGGAGRAQAQWAAEVVSRGEGKGPAGLREGRRAPPFPLAGSSGRQHVRPRPGSSPARPLPGSGHAAAYLCRRDGARPGRYAGGKRGLLKSLGAGLQPRACGPGVGLGEAEL